MKFFCVNIRIELETGPSLLKNDKFDSNFVLIKQKFPYYMILPTKMANSKARFQSVELQCSS